MTSPNPNPGTPLAGPGYFPSPAGPRNIVLLLDGTSNQFSEHNTNLIKLLSVIKADESQLVYYSSGLGTVLPESSGAWGKLRQKGAQIFDMGFAFNFDEFVCDAYRYLMEYYRTGDKIYLFGFSRGAYTARALAGMIQRVGLLPAGNANQVTLAYEMYTGPEHLRDSKKKDPSVLYRRIFGRSRPVAVEFLGVWDTVSSLGGLDIKLMPFAAGAKSVKICRHALALDERRARFAPEFWRRDEHETDLLHKVADIKAQLKAKPSDAALEKELAKIEKKLNDDYPATALVGPSGAKREMLKSVECWFQGCHSDVGGGTTLNDEPSLSNIPFRWMLREAVHCGLLLDPEGVAYQKALIIPVPPPQPTLSSAVTTETPAKPADNALKAIARLRDLLEEQGYDARRESEQEDEVEKLRRALPQAELTKIIEVAAALDSAQPASGFGAVNSLSKDQLAGMNESLVGVWNVLEHIILKTRKYTKDGDKEKTEISVNHGDGRQIIPGQKCHRSVLLRLLYEAHHHGSKKLQDGEKAHYDGPAAHVATGWPEWDAVKRGEEYDDEIWLD